MIFLLNNYFGKAKEWGEDAREVFEEFYIANSQFAPDEVVKGSTVSSADIMKNKT